MACDGRLGITDEMSHELDVVDGGAHNCITWCCEIAIGHTGELSD